MLQCKVDYLCIYGRKEHAIALFFWDDSSSKETDAVHVALDADLFKEGTFHQIADTIEIAINSCLEKIHQKEIENGGQKIHPESN